jgi:hypothetical protein
VRLVRLAHQAPVIVIVLELQCPNDRRIEGQTRLAPCEFVRRSFLNAAIRSRHSINAKSMSNGCSEFNAFWGCL